MQIGMLKIYFAIHLLNEAITVMRCLLVVCTLLLVLVSPVMAQQSDTVIPVAEIEDQISTSQANGSNVSRNPTDIKNILSTEAKKKDTLFRTDDLDRAFLPWNEFKKRMS